MLAVGNYSERRVYHGDTENTEEFELYFTQISQIAQIKY